MANEKKEKSNNKEHLDRIRKMPLKKFPSWLLSMIDERNELIKSGKVNSLHVYVAQPNRKNAPHSVSTIPVADCVNCSDCSLQCYDIRHDCRNKTVQHTRAVNSAILHADRERFFREIDGRCKSLDKLRWFVGGDITDVDFFDRMVKLCMSNSHCVFHIFTKNYDAVNEWLSAHIGCDPLFSCEEVRTSFETLVPNMHLRFSSWPGVEMSNPYNIRTSEVVFEDQFIPTDEHSALCTGNCTDCCIHGSGCFDRDIQRILLPVH